ncbi:MAG: hypothetical protein C4K60_14035 [Ideonella sp. MAG2]|nr:MAG: hypothetical protein C4K60_14035 [Ideonella sp. MAG2]
MPNCAPLGCDLCFAPTNHSPSPTGSKVHLTVLTPLLSACSRRHWLAVGMAAAAGPRLCPATPDTGPQAPRHALVVGQTLSLDAGRNPAAVAVRQGIETALQVVRLNGGIRGRPLWLRSLDDQGQPEAAARNAQRLADEGALLLFAPLGDACASAVLAVASRRQMPLMAPLSGLARFYEAIPSGVYPVRASARAECEFLWGHARTMGMRRVAVLHLDDEFGRSLRDDAHAAAEALGLPPVLSMSLAPGSSAAALAPLLERARHVDMVLLLTDGPAAAEFVRQLRRLGLRAVVMGLSTCAAGVLAQLGPEAYGLQFSQVVPSPWGASLHWVQQFQLAFKASFRGQPLSHLCLEAYVSTLALAEALRNAGPQPTRESLRAALHNSSVALDGFSSHYLDGQARGSRYVDMALVGHDGRWRQ